MAVLASVPQLNVQRGSETWDNGHNSVTLQNIQSLMVPSRRLSRSCREPRPTNATMPLSNHELSKRRPARRFSASDEFIPPGCEEKFRAEAYRIFAGRRNGLRTGAALEITPDGSLIDCTKPDVSTRRKSSACRPTDLRKSCLSNVTSKCNMSVPAGVATVEGRTLPVGDSDATNELKVDSAQPQQRPKRMSMFDSEITQKQIEAFREVFDLFDRDGGGTIDSTELNDTLRSVNICLQQEDIEEVLGAMDIDGDGEINFQEFLKLLTSTNRFLQNISTEEPQTSIATNREAILFDALTEFMKKKTSTLADVQEIVGYYHQKYKKSEQTPHVVNHYAAGARLIGLNEKQLKEHIIMLQANNSPETEKSPYAQPISLVRSVSAFSSSAKKKTRNQCVDRPPTGQYKTAGGDRNTNKPRNWTSQRTEHIAVQLPAGYLKLLEPYDELTTEDTYTIRAQVAAASHEYMRTHRKSQNETSLRHWKTLFTEQIRSCRSRDIFRDVFTAYTGLSRAQLTD